MKNLFDATVVDEVKTRLGKLTPESERQWGKMSPAQAVAHCSRAMEWSLGDTVPPRLFLGRILGLIVKPILLKNDQPIRRNAPTVKSLVVDEQCDLGAERQQLSILIDRFTAAGPTGCTKNAHSFFGPLAPEEWAILMYKHLDHHLRQFGV